MSLMSMMPRRVPSLFERRAPMLGRVKRPPAADAAAAPDDAAAGCGWFDSSHALSAGLVVLEHAPCSATGRLLPGLG
ncbi:MAG: hypothetical protein ABIN96_11535 [Rubrivivax sp.]